jgi:hypothetical protein
VDGSLLLDENGRLVRRVSHPGAVGSFGHSRDERLIWIVSNIWRGARKIGELRVVDTEGRVVAQSEFGTAKTFTVQYEGRTYPIPVEVPTHP